MADDNTIEFEEIEIEGETELASPEMYAANLVEWAAERHASDIFISDDRRSVIVAVKRLGRVEMVRRLARVYGNRLQGHFRVLANAGAGDFIHPAEGRGVVSAGARDIDFRLSAVPTVFGQDVSIRIFSPSRARRRLEGLGMDETELETFKRLLDLRSGLILVSGPVASGKTNTLYAALHYLHDGTRKIHTLEDPVEHTIPGIQQSQVNLRAGVDFVDLLVTVLRHSPDVIMVGEIRDAETAQIAVRAGASGQMVLASLHADSAPEAIDVLRQYGVHPNFLARTLIGVISQQLVRRLCVACRRKIDGVEVHLEPRVRDRLGDVEPTFYMPGHCAKCFESGYEELTCVPEILVINREIEEAIMEGAPSRGIEKIARRSGMLSIAEAAQLRVLRGETTAPEALRAIDDPDLARFGAAPREAS